MKTNAYVTAPATASRNPDQICQLNFLIIALNETLYYTVTSGAIALRRSSQRHQWFQPIFSKIKAKPDEDSSQNLHVKRIAHSPVRTDRAADVSRQQNRAHHRSCRNQIDNHTSE